jgi:hypothetical protein
MRQMNESEKIQEYFQNTQSRQPEDRPHDRVELASNVETMIAANAAFQQAVVEAGANEGSMLVNVEPLTANELTSKRGGSCPFSHPDAYKGTKKGPGGAGAQPATTGPAATAPAVPTAVPTAQADGTVAGTLCKQCNKKERYREGGKFHPYCGQTCAEEALERKIGQPKQDAKLSNNAMIQEEDNTWMGSNYMALAGISHVEMLEEAASLGFVSGSVHAADEGAIYSPGMVALLQSKGFIFMNEFSESEPSEMEYAAQESEVFSEIEEAALDEVSEVEKVEGKEVQSDLQDDDWVRVPPKLHRRELGVAKEEMKEPFAAELPDAGYYSVLDNAEEEHHAYRIACSHETTVAAFSPVLEIPCWHPSCSG